MFDSIPGVSHHLYGPIELSFVQSAMDMPYTDAFGLAAINAGLPGLFGAERSDPIVIGLEGPLTGDQRSTGRDMWRGAKLAVEELNREGGILGRRVKLVRADDRADPERALSVAKGLNRLDADAVIGPYNSGVGIINLPYYVKKEIIPVHLTSTDDTSGLGVTIQPKNSQIAPAEEAYILAQGVQRISMLVDPSAFTVDQADRLEKALVADGVQVDRFSIVPGSLDYEAVIEEALATDPGLVYVSTYFPEGSVIAQGLAAAGSAAQPFFGLANVDPAFVAQAGLDIARLGVFSGVPEAPQLPDAGAYVDAYEERFDRTPGVWGTFTYDSIKVLAEAIETAGTVNYGPALGTLLQTTDYQGATGEISIDPLTGNRVDVPVEILKVDRNGAFVLAD
ncbi:MAG: branched-chain amino acid ABC transporter substrate-binding protein [Vulcanococcus sp.]